MAPRTACNLGRVAGLAGLGTLGLVLYRFPPAEHRFYPVCPIHWATGLLCPGCGATRALAALLHGKMHEAMALNALFVVVILPLALVYLAVAFRRGRWPAVPMPLLYGYAAVMLVFTVVRNLS